MADDLTAELETVIAEIDDLTAVFNARLKELNHKRLSLIEKMPTRYVLYKCDDGNTLYSVGTLEDGISFVNENGYVFVEDPGFKPLETLWQIAKPSSVGGDRVPFFLREITPLDKDAWDASSKWLIENKGSDNDK